MGKPYYLPNGLYVNAAGWVDTSTAEWQQVCYRLNQENIARVRTQKYLPRELYVRTGSGYVFKERVPSNGV